MPHAVVTLANRPTVIFSAMILLVVLLNGCTAVVGAPSSSSLLVLACCISLAFAVPVALSALLIIGCGGSEPGDLKSLARASLAQIDGELTGTGLKETVEVVRDQYGIPHIYAQNVDDLFFAQGYVMAQDRLWQLEMWRRCDARSIMVKEDT